jgi:release factor glutamine methyltransferase
VSTAESGGLGDLLRRTARDLAAAGLELPALEARLLVGHVLGLEREAMLADRGRPVGGDQVSAVESLAVRRRSGEPLAYILGEREFWSLPLRVTPEVLIPRPDSEAVVELALRRLGRVKGPIRILDLGTGSGCLLLALLSECPQAWGVGSDRSEAAVRLASDNARRLRLDGRCVFVCADWGSALGGNFDLIVCNPPYVDDASFAALDPAVRCHEPAAALRGGADGLDAYRAVAGELVSLLAVGGLAVFELGAGQHHEVAALAASAGLGVVAVGHDLAGHERCIALGRR